MQFISKHPMLSLVWIVLCIGVILVTFQSKFSKVNDIARGEAISLINKEDAVIVDLRNHDDFRKGNIVNSLNLTVLDIKSGNLGKLNKLKNKPVIIVCTNGIISRDSAKSLIKAGFEKVYVLKEGISGWDKENLPLVQGK